MSTCPYYQISDTHVHALVGDGSHGTGERIQTVRCQACRTTFSARCMDYRLHDMSFHATA